MRKLFTISILLFMLAVPQAQARVTPPPEGWGDAYLHAAESWWQREPACTYSVVYDAKIPYLSETTFGEGTCVAYISPMHDDTIYSRCAEVVHVYGYLLGEPPNDDIHSVMYHGGPFMAGIPSCKALVRAVHAP